jgi:hypothetical protein
MSADFTLARINARVPKKWKLKIQKEILESDEHIDESTIIRQALKLRWKMQEDPKNFLSDL